MTAMQVVTKALGDACRVVTDFAKQGTCGLLYCCGDYEKNCIEQGDGSVASSWTPGHCQSRGVMGSKHHAMC